MTLEYLGDVRVLVDLYLKVLFVGERTNFKKNPTHTQDHGDA